MSRFTSGVAAVLRHLVAREELPPPPSQARRSAGPGSLLARLLTPDPLDPAPPPVGASRVPPSRGALALLLGPEPFPSDLPEVPRRRGRWLAWLFAPEPLDP